MYYTNKVVLHSCSKTFWKFCIQRIITCKLQTTFCETVNFEKCIISIPMKTDLFASLDSILIFVFFKQTERSARHNI